MSTPTNRNFLSPKGFKFNLPRCATVSRNAQQVSIPSISMTAADVPTPFVKIPMPGDHIDYGEFTISFIVDEDMVSYLEIYNWILEMGAPDSLESSSRIYNALPGQGTGPVSDATLTILTSKNNANINILFKGLFPVALSELAFSAEEADIVYLKCTVTFRYISFTLTQI